MNLYDTHTRTLRPFEPLVAGRVGIYVCGATVQAPPHVGHIRSGLSFDILRRWLMASNFDVTYIRNVTDIDDKIIHNASHEDVPYWVVAMRNERAFTWAYDVLGCLPPTYEPRATGHIPEMVALMQRLIDIGYAYEVDGTVWFSVRSWKSYGSLSGQRLDDITPSADAATLGKRDLHDFALWKAAKTDEPYWDTPWGPGRPGWHIECSAMATKYLGAEFDIHGGGIDLVFPHHENEIAQSCSAGDAYARYWLHNAWVTTAGEKMSKSLGNSLLVTEVVKRVRPIELRYYLGAVHYRSMLEFSYEALEESAVGFRRVEAFLVRATEAAGRQLTMGMRSEVFDASMDDDLGVPGAIASMHDTVRAGNAALAVGDNTAAVTAAESVIAMLDVLGLNPYASHWSTSAAADGSRDKALGVLVAGALQARTDARAKKDFAAADAVRDQLVEAGIVIEDTPAGPRWTVG
ncbi:MAG: cysteine--tRNA ligase [Actinobacteria bacterium]|nr:cysteine--tRNA ligase [Actinomycetota bacterium]